VRVLIPTDVSEFYGGAPHANLDLTEGIVSRRTNTLIDYGSSCCLVQNATGGERYLLTCYHVFSPSLSDSPGDIDCVASGGGTPIGPMLEVADPQSTTAALDAALALMEDASVGVVSTWGRYPSACATEFDIQSLHPGAELFVHGRRVAPAFGGQPEVTRLAPLPATFQSVFPNPIPFDYRRTAGKVLYFADTLQYVAGVRPGDSGAAVLDGEGTLFGMHFYGQDTIGFAFSAPRLFDANIFPFDIVLR
jgi:hypothetical protein